MEGSITRKEATSETEPAVPISRLMRNEKVTCKAANNQGRYDCFLVTSENQHIRCIMVFSTKLPR